MFDGEIAGMNTSSTLAPLSAAFRLSMSRCSRAWPR
jgi:hypothetical protein